MSKKKIKINGADFEIDGRLFIINPVRALETAIKRCADE